jgi:hypothetical protein
MSAKHWLLAAAMLLPFLRAATADDMAFGADALGHLAGSADVIIVTGDPSRLGSDPQAAAAPYRAKFATFSVRAEEVLKGNVAVGDIVRIAILEGPDLPGTDDLAHAIVFLRPLPAAQLAQTNISAGTQVYVVVSGSHGVIDASLASRKAAVRAYLEVAGSGSQRREQLLGWTERNLASADAFLQNSAVVELHSESDDPRAVRQLGEALGSDAVLPSVKRSAIRALESSSVPAAAVPLRELAENTKMPRVLRQEAVKALREVPGGEQHLRRWSAGSDSILAPAARAALDAKQ